MLRESGASSNRRPICINWGRRRLLEFHCARACLPALRGSGAGTILNSGGLSAHSGAKDRGDGEGGFGRLHPGTGLRPCRGRHHRQLRGSRPDRHAAAQDTPEPAHHLTQQTLSGRRGTPEDVAATVRFLCGPAARYITGQAIQITGGAYFSA
jgi:3-oxoacyl-[acyl-carrier protein] reductase